MFPSFSHPWIGQSLFAALCAGLLSLAQAAPDPDYPLVLKEIRAQCEKFPLFSLERDASGKAPFQYIRPAESYFLSKGYRYFGFRFKAPNEITGDFSWVFLLRNQTGPLTVEFMQWDILSRDDESSGFYTFERFPISRYPDLKAKFPHTHGFTLQQQPKSFFKPGKEYIIWFRISANQKLPEYAAAISFMSRNQEYPEAKLPLGSPKVAPKPTTYEGDPW